MAAAKSAMKAELPAKPTLRTEAAEGIPEESSAKEGGKAEDPFEELLERELDKYGLRFDPKP